MSSQMYYKDFRVKRLKKFETKDFFFLNMTVI